MPLIENTAPDFTLPTDGGGRFTLSDSGAEFVVLFFYPKDDTPGCTKEAIGFTEKVDEFAALDAKIVGISKDPVAKHDKFIAKHDLAVTLVSDAESDVCENYGTWVEKNMYGKKYMGIERSTLLIGKDLMILQTWSKVKVPGHVDAVLEALKTHANA